MAATAELPDLRCNVQWFVALRLVLFPLFHEIHRNVTVTVILYENSMATCSTVFAMSISFYYLFKSVLS